MERLATALEVEHVHGMVELQADLQGVSRTTIHLELALETILTMIPSELARALSRTTIHLELARALSRTTTHLELALGVIRITIHLVQVPKVSVIKILGVNLQDLVESAHI